MKSMGERYLRIYDVLLPAAYKADVWRYTVVYKYGGCYMDAGSITVRPLVELLRPEDEFVSS
jgi:mannosyltransferase OCH1-like enzyme